MYRFSHREEKLGAYNKLRKEVGIDEISGSQLSRRINDLPTKVDFHTYLIFYYIFIVKETSFEDVNFP